MSTIPAASSLRLNRVTALLIVIVGVVCMLPSASAFDSAKQYKTDLQPYEPSFIGATADDNRRGDGYMDFALSVKYRLPEWMPLVSENRVEAYFAFNGRWGQYFGRDSAPVIGKRFNPKLFYRLIRPQEVVSDMTATNVKWDSQQGRDYIDISYNHESDGQSVNSAKNYRELQSSSADPLFANDYISRGWDYLETTAKMSRPAAHGSYTIVGDVKLFLHKGFLQGVNEEYSPYSDWETNSKGKSRRAVDGLSGTFEYRWSHDGAMFGSPRIVISPTTGLDPIFKFHTIRIEGGARLWRLPVTVWIEHGYNRSLSMYYQRGTSYGIGFQFGNS